MSKFKKGDEVWVKGVYDISDNGMLWVKIPCDHALRPRACDTCTVKVRTDNVVKLQRTRIVIEDYQAYEFTPEPHNLNDCCDALIYVVREPRPRKSIKLTPAKKAKKKGAKKR